MNEELFEFLRILSKNHKVGILTNGASNVQIDKIRKHGISEFVDEIIISNDIGARKPDEEIFEIAKKKLNAENYVYIGDTFDEDIRPASNSGFKTIYISGEESADLQSHNPESFAQVINLFMKDE